MTLEQQAQSLLIATRKLLTPEERWGQGHYCADYDANDQPQRFCLVGGVLHLAEMKSAILPRESAAREAITRMESQMADRYVFLHHWNDEPGRTHAEVLKLLDDTIGQEAK